jgi:predicted nucleic acid-binding protein
MRFVLDASIAIVWAMRDEAHTLADRAFLELQAGSAIVPGIWWYEIRNILALNERRGRITPDDCAEFIHALEQFKIEIVFPQDGTQVMELSRKHRLSIYDAAYLSIAKREQLSLATLDRALAAAALSEGIPSLN